MCIDRIKYLITLLCCLPWQLHAETTPSAELQHYLNSLQQFQAQFQQQVIDEQGEVIQQASGSMAVARPNRFHWQVEVPDEELMVADGEALWIYNPFLEQVTVLDLQQALAQSPFMLLMSDQASVWQQYQISKIATGFSIKPLTPQLVSEIQVQLEGEQISQLILLDSQGKTSQFSLSQFDAKTDLAESLFQFTPPTDVDLDDQRE